MDRLSVLHDFHCSEGERGSGDSFFFRLRWVVYEDPDGAGAFGDLGSKPQGEGVFDYFVWTDISEGQGPVTGVVAVVPRGTDDFSA